MRRHGLTPNSVVAPLKSQAPCQKSNSKLQGVKPPCHGAKLHAISQASGDINDHFIDLSPDWKYAPEESYYDCDAPLIVKFWCNIEAQWGCTNEENAKQAAA